MFFCQASGESIIFGCRITESLTLEVGKVPGDEEAFDAVGITDAYLDVVLFAEAGGGI